MNAILFGAGRLSRLHYLMWRLGIFASVAGLFAITADPANRFLGLVPLMWLLGATATRRAHDVNHTGWVVVMIFVPGVNIIAELYLFLAPSWDLPNRWGKPAAGFLVLDHDEIEAAKRVLAAEAEEAEHQRNAQFLNDDGSFRTDGLLTFDPD